MTNRELAKQALDALDQLADRGNESYFPHAMSELAEFIEQCDRMTAQIQEIEDAYGLGVLDLLEGDPE